MDDYQKQQMEQLGLGEAKNTSDDPYSLVSRR